MWVYWNSVVPDRWSALFARGKMKALLSELFSGRNPSWGVLWMICVTFSEWFLWVLFRYIFLWNMEKWFCGNRLGDWNLFSVTKYGKSKECLQNLLCGKRIRLLGLGNMTSLKIENYDWIFVVDFINIVILFSFFFFKTKPQ